MSSQRTN